MISVAMKLLVGHSHSECGEKIGPEIAQASSREVELSKMAWLFILLAGAFEMTWPFVLKWLTRFPSTTRWSPLLVVVLFAIPICYLLAESLKRLPAATVYATFVGIGTAGTAIIGMLFFGESTSLGRVCSLALLLAGLIGLKAFSGAAQ